MKVLELFAGTRSIGRAFEERGHEVYSVEWDKRFGDIDLYEDIMKVQAADIIRDFGRPDVIWASPDCSSYSVAAISYHRKKDENGNLVPKTDYARFCDRVNQHVLCLILALSPKYWFIENPRGGYAQDGLYERAAPLHDHLLPIWGDANEADRHLDEPPEPEIQTAVPQGRPMSCPRTKGRKDRDARYQGERGEVKDSRGLLQTYCKHM